MEEEEQEEEEEEAKKKKKKKKVEEKGEKAAREIETRRGSRPPRSLGSAGVKIHGNCRCSSLARARARAREKAEVPDERANARGSPRGRSRVPIDRVTPPRETASPSEARRRGEEACADGSTALECLPSFTVWERGVVFTVVGEDS